LRSAYIHLVKLWHPDRYVSAPEALRARAERRVRQINAAYDTLSDPEARARYDRQRVGGEMPIGDVINVFGQRGPAPIMRDARAADGHASANPNGAGQFFGLLAAILALGLIGGALSGAGLGSGIGAVVVLVGIVALLFAALFFMEGSPLAKWANGAMEAEPKQFAGARRAAERARQRRPQPPPARESPPADAAPPDRVALFDALIAEALAAVPPQFDEYLRNVVVRAEEEPDEATLRAAGVPEGHTLLGLYQGVSLTRRGAGEVGPEIITIYRGPIERYCGGDLARMRLQVRATVWHELAHHFGLDHDEMPDSVK
jgi:predicted Zn-dependent protease with MMP-like domain